jgi:hypothetical protein
MSDKPRDLLIEEAASAFRERNCWGRILPSPAWLDLSMEDRDRLFGSQLESRLVERALDPAGLSNTARAVLARLKTPGA